VKLSGPKDTLAEKKKNFHNSCKTEKQQMDYFCGDRLKAMGTTEIRKSLDNTCYSEKL